VVPLGAPGGDKDDGVDAIPVSSLERSSHIGQGRSSRYGSVRLPTLPLGVLVETQRLDRRRGMDAG